jgi:RNA polymerase sigma factor (sigma-70 family)
LEGTTAQELGANDLSRKPINSKVAGRTTAESFLRLSDETLVRAAQKGHAWAFDALCERYERRIFRSALRITRNREDAEDSVQDALLSAFVHIRAFDGRSSFATWLTRIAINSALMILRKKRSSIEIASKDSQDSAAGEQSLEMPDHAPNPENRYVQKEEVSALKEAIRALRPSLRNVVEIQQLQERSLRETAAAMRISIAATKSRLLHAKVALRKSRALKIMQQPRSSSGLRVSSAL